MTAEMEIREIHDLTSNVAQHYMAKYGEEAVPFLEKAATAFEDNDDIHGRNRLLRLRDEILIARLQAR
ncbi:MAG: hypothetical protein COB93_08785 [Sneathiella sp.]|nr:MAG: hypothetical protein COB93_08785 [Sneathiella sp.]